MLKLEIMKLPEKIILVEDDKKKIEDIAEFLAAYFSYTNLIVKESYQSGLRELINEKYDLLLLDMSIPTWDKSPIESGGYYEKFGGYKILKEIVRKKKPVKTILITMFDDFGESDTSITLDELNRSLRNEFDAIYKGSVFYSSKQSKWRDELKDLIEQDL